MAYTHTNALNRFGNTPLIVATDPANGSHTTLAGALADATTGQTVFLRNSVTENVTLPAGVNIAAWQGSSANTPSITGKITFSGAGTSSISGVKLITNSDNVLAVTGTENSIIWLYNCYLSIVDNVVGMICSSSGASVVNLQNCSGDLSSATASYFAFTSGVLNVFKGYFINSIGSTVVNTFVNANGSMSHTTFNAPISNSTSGSFGTRYSTFAGGGLNSTMLTFASGSNNVRNCIVEAGTASAISVGAAATSNIYNTIVNSSNTNAVSGIGQINYSEVLFSGSSSIMNTTTQVASYTNLGKWKASGQPAFLAHVSASVPNVTGNAAAYTIIFDTEDQDVSNNFNNTTGVFTAPVTGNYSFSTNVRMNAIGAGMSTAYLSLITTSRTIRFGEVNPVSVEAASTLLGLGGSAICPMTAGDTAKIQVVISGGGGDTAGVGGSSVLISSFSGQLIS